MIRLKTIEITYKETVRTLYLYEAAHPVGLVIFLHGAGEYALKYERLANDLNLANYSVLLFDQLGHGLEAKTRGFTHFSDEDGHLLLLEYLHKVINFASTLYDEMPLYLMAHSMGSFIARSYLNTYPTLFKAHVFIGSSLMRSKDLLFGKILATLIRRFKGPKHISKFFTHLMQDKPYQSMKKRGLVEARYEWVTQDPLMQEKYKDDPLMHHSFTISAQLDVIKLMTLAQSRKHGKHHASDSLNAFLCGDQDALCDYGKGTKALTHHYKSLGYSNLVDIVFSNSRHELLHEVSYKEVTNTIIDLLKKA